MVGKPLIHGFPGETMRTLDYCSQKIDAGFTRMGHHTSLAIPTLFLLLTSSSSAPPSLFLLFILKQGYPKLTRLVKGFAQHARLPEFNSETPVEVDGGK